jgi:hypothetical protein
LSVALVEDARRRRGEVRYSQRAVANRMTVGAASCSADELKVSQAISHLSANTWWQRAG